MNYDLRMLVSDEGTGREDTTRDLGERSFWFSRFFVGDPIPTGKRLWLLLALLLTSIPVRAATVLPLEFRQNDTTFNLSSRRGVPISRTAGNPAGSDGRQPLATENESGSNLPATGAQFQSVVSFGGVSAAIDHNAITTSAILRNGTTPFSPIVAAEMQLPLAKSNGVVVMVLRRAHAGVPYLNRQVSFLFGSVIPVPETDEQGGLLSIVPEQYWLPEPHSTTGHTNDHYYWSPHARKVFAIQPGPISITWKKANPITALPPGANAADYYQDGGYYFRLFTKTYIISGSSVKTPRKIYWTEKSFQQIGKIVHVPTARVPAVNVVYNTGFPTTVPAEYVGPGQTSPTDGTTNNVLPELRTVWFDQQSGNVHAYNREGRVFVELLGDLKGDGQTRQSLGYEIVDVFKQVNPIDLKAELGQRLVPPAPFSVTELSPEPIPSQLGVPFAYEHTGAGLDSLELFATRETQNLNDYLVHWMETGEAGLKWPSQFARYQMVWPAEISKYSHYVRPLVGTEAEAQLTAVPLATTNVPVIAYQDDISHPRAKLTAETKFYTFLTGDFPAHRTLLRFNSGEQVAFERVFSWLGANLQEQVVGNRLVYTNLANSVATNLNNYSFTNGSLVVTDLAKAPRTVAQTVNVGQRINAPSGEVGANGSQYLAGYILQSAGKSFHAGAYIDPFVEGFEAADKGAIIPVNAVPGTNHLEVWWFRSNGADTSKGFSTIHWPSVIGRYTIQWPGNPLEIVLASNQGSAGSGVNDPLVALGNIYSQNDKNLAGYNPNEEHALMSGGSAFALRDDLNITNGANYSSHPFVLVEYTAADNRPAMAAYKVIREKPEVGWVFDYIVNAGTLLQPPMPLGLLPPPVEGIRNYNTETPGGDLPGSWDQNRDGNGPFRHYNKFTYRDRKDGFWVYRGLHAGLPALQAGSYQTNNHTFGNLPSARAVVGRAFNYFIHASHPDQYLTLTAEPSLRWLSVQGLSLHGVPASADVGSHTLNLIVRNSYEGSAVTNQLTVTVAATGTTATQGPLQILSTNTHTGVVMTFSNRPPFLAHSPGSSNSFAMRFYYKTLEDFHWPGMAQEPGPGTVVPYLRRYDPANGTYAGAPDSKDTTSLEIVYRPVWPVLDVNSQPVPTMPYGLTLMKPMLGLPGVRDFKTARVLYQQSLAANITTTNAVSVILHDPTREKISDLKANGLTALPGGVETDFYQGKYYFPKLPPHLSQRLYFDPNRGTNGTLVLIGEFKEASAGDSYVLLNVLTGSDLEAANGLCPASDPNYSKWSSLIGNLSTRVETFTENTATTVRTNFVRLGGRLLPISTTTVVVGLGTFSPNPELALSVGAGSLAPINSDNTAVDSYALSATGPGHGYVTLIESDGTAFTEPGDPVAMHIFKVGDRLYPGELKVIPAPNPLSEQITFQHTGDLAGRASEYEYQWKIAAPVDGLPPVPDPEMSRFLPLSNPANIAGLFRYTLGGAGVQSLSDNYVVMRYRPINRTHPLYQVWSDWTEPKLAEGWIKRALAGINPFNQRTKDLFNNRVVTDSSIIQQAGHRWEGDIALNADTLNNYGLIEIYETILRRGRSLSIESGFNYGPANDALLLAAGYLNDLYMMLGNEAWADAANPTIGMGTKDTTYGEMATALFSFKGQVPTLLEEELALLRGRDDFLLPNVRTAPFYNRLIWNYTRGIDAGQAIYALNYDIKDMNQDSVADSTDAAMVFPQAHGDAYGHYLTALKGYASLLMNRNFDWVPRIEAVTVLDQPVSVDYTDERKFAAAAAALARAGNQIFDLTWRQDYQSHHAGGWDHFGSKRANPTRTYNGLAGDTNNTVRYWGMDHWAARTGQGTFLNWVIGNSMVPAVDPNPLHEGIQKIDRTTIPELQELPATAEALQAAMDNAEGSLTPLGLPEGSVPFDINPNQVVGGENDTHFEQVYQRAKVALQNAVSAFDDAKDISRLMRSEQDSLDDLRFSILKQEIAYTNALIEFFGTPYPDDIGPGKTYPQGFAGPDLIHFAYVETPQLNFTNLPSNTTQFNLVLDTHELLAGRVNEIPELVADHRQPFGARARLLQLKDVGVTPPPSITFTFDAGGNFSKPSGWTSRRASPGRLQQSIALIHQARTAGLQTLHDHEELVRRLENGYDFLLSKKAVDDYVHRWDVAVAGTQAGIDGVKFLAHIYKLYSEFYGRALERGVHAAAEAIPKDVIAGLAVGGDTLSGARAILFAQYAVARSTLSGSSAAIETAQLGFTLAKENYLRLNTALNITPLTLDLENKRMVVELDAVLGEVQNSLFTINQRIQELDDAVNAYRSILAQGERLLDERKVFRDRSAALVQGFRTRDAAFRLFRSEKLERYKTLFDLSARYAFLAANAYDYETGLLHTEEGRAFIDRIVNSRALGVVRNGEPQYAGSNTGDPGLSSILAEMKADWDVVKGRLGFNNPDAYGTTASLRTEYFRIVPGTNGLSNWQDLLRRSRKADVLEDEDVRRYCMQIGLPGNVPVPGIILEFNTTISPGFNIFGQRLAAGDHAYSSSSFATKIFGAGVAFEGYRGMDNPSANSSLVTSVGGTSPNDPDSWYLDSLALSANPYVYLIPVGADAMRTPPLGDTSIVRSWMVNDVAIPLPFNLGESDFSTKPLYQSSDSLTEPLFTLRKHQAFRPISDASLFNSSLYTVGGTLQRSQYTNNRLVGRSVWNTKWKLVIPGYTLLHNPTEGIDRFTQTVTDIKVHYVTYSYSGN